MTRVLKWLNVSSSGNYMMIFFEEGPPTFYDETFSLFCIFELNGNIFQGFLYQSLPDFTGLNVASLSTG
jgi:hypothetical protein